MFLGVFGAPTGIGVRDDIGVVGGVIIGYASTLGKTERSGFGIGVNFGLSVVSWAV